MKRNCEVYGGSLEKRVYSLIKYFLTNIQSFQHQLGCEKCAESFKAQGNQRKIFPLTEYIEIEEMKATNLNSEITPKIW